MTSRLIHTFNAHAGAVYSLACGAGEHTFFSASGDHFVAEWNLGTLSQQPFAIKLEKPAFSVIYLQKFNLIIAGNSEGEFHVIDYLEKKELRHFVQHTKGIYDFAFDAQDNLLLVAGGDGVLTAWSVPDFKLVRTIPLCAEKLRRLSISPDNNMVAVACGDGKVRILDLIFFNEIATLDAHKEGATSVAWHPRKPILVTGGKDALLKCWNINDNYREVLSIAAHNFAIYSIRFHPEKNYCATCSRDKSVKIWDSSTFDALLKIDQKHGSHSHSVNDIQWTSKGLLSCGDDRHIHLFALED